MRIAIFSDIHGNPHACDAVLKDIQKEGTFDHIVAAGDLCLGGSNPKKCLGLLHDMEVKVVYGNTDEYIFAPNKVPGDDLHKNKWDRLKITAFWNREQLGETWVKWLSETPLQFNIFA